ncbi:MAG: hypothetical protein NT167_32105 [Verrucomicrobia bacterium]|nr:hypothetical protein [Verrucomicrobiota bacterium]
MEIDFDLGTFEGFNFRDQSAIFGNLTAAEVISWDHNEQGEAEFWPAGDRPEVAMLFKSRSTVSGSELHELNRLLNELGGDDACHFLQIHYAINVSGSALSDLTREQVEDYPLQIFFGTSFLDVRREAAYEMFELYYPEEYRVWEKSHCDGLIFDTDWFLDSPVFYTEQIRLGDQVALLVVAQ